MNRFKKKAVFYIVTAALVISLIEFFSYVFFSAFHERFTFYNLDQYLLRSEDIGLLTERYDCRLGWDNRYDTKYNERPRTVSYDKPLISTFGDSYTHCSDVPNDETWQTYLSGLLRADVYNFGTGGYGTDQAYLKFLSVYPKLQTPIVILGLTTENINRIVNVYRPFYFAKTGIRLTKPRFEMRDGKLVLLDNPIKSEVDIKMLEREEFIKIIGRDDWWYNRDDYPVFRFPYSKILLNKRMWLEVFYGKVNREIDDTDPRPWENLWDEQKVTDLMFAIIESFVNEVRDYRGTPVIMILPMQNQVFHKFVTGEYPKEASMVLNYCKRRNYLYFDSITALAESVDTMDQIPRLFVVHLSAEGNRIVAGELFKFVRTHIADEAATL
jgi:hypothetical protein